jgi:hypothetical protein
MPRSKNRIVSLEEVKAHFEEWRGSRWGKAPIPDELWLAAGEVARQEGVSRTSTGITREVESLEAAHGGSCGGITQYRPMVITLKTGQGTDPGL